MLVGDDLVRLAVLLVEVKGEFETRREAACSVTGRPRSLISDVPHETSPALLAYPTQPSVPIQDHLVVMVDEVQIDQHLTVACHQWVREHAAHQAAPVDDAAGGVVALVAVGRRCETQPRGITLHQCHDHVPVGGVITDQAVRVNHSDIARVGYYHNGYFRHIVGRARLASFRL